MYDGMIRKDRQLLEEVLAGSFVLVHMTGMRQTKKEFIQAVMDGTLNYDSASHHEISAEFHGNTAVLIGKSIVRAAVFGGSRHTWRLQQDLKLDRIGDDSWVVTEAVASTW